MNAIYQDRKFIPSKARHGVTGTQALLEAASKGNQHRITGGMPQAVVDVFKMVDIQKYHRGDCFSVAPGLRDHDFNRSMKRARSGDRSAHRTVPCGSIVLRAVCGW